MIPSDMTKDIHDALNEMLEDCRKRGDHYYELAKNEKSSETTVLGIVYARLEQTLLVTKMNAVVMDSIIKAMEQLPNRQEFDVVRIELEKARKVINDVVKPLKSQIDEANEREARADDVYG